MFVTVDLRTVILMQFVRMFIAYRHTEFHIPSIFGPLIIAVRAKSKNALMVAMF